jgi:hypothetical protein
MSHIRQTISHMKRESTWTLQEIYSLPIPELENYWRDLVEIKERENKAIERARNAK